MRLREKAVGRGPDGEGEEGDCHCRTRDPLGRSVALVQQRPRVEASAGLRVRPEAYRHPALCHAPNAAPAIHPRGSPPCRQPAHPSDSDIPPSPYKAPGLSRAAPAPPGPELDPAALPPPPPSTLAPARRPLLSSPRRTRHARVPEPPTRRVLVQAPPPRARRRVPPLDARPRADRPRARARRPRAAPQEPPAQVRRVRRAAPPACRVPPPPRVDAPHRRVDRQRRRRRRGKGTPVPAPLPPHTHACSRSHLGYGAGTRPDHVLVGRHPRRRRRRRRLRGRPRARPRRVRPAPVSAPPPVHVYPGRAGHRALRDLHRVPPLEPRRTRARARPVLYPALARVPRAPACAAPRPRRVRAPQIFSARAALPPLLALVHIRGGGAALLLEEAGCRPRIPSSRLAPPTCAVPGPPCVIARTTA
ncbi:hypothetical protein DAEQUDRAFT_347759 [Daedalea quercina L-15889]|uniref:Uncharacterized protein n=1 Tax=Daedalea quercina L-15889 TaxID=1314783 RepID=A0A165PD51_9APHY|nr:hypothetical protein DAEQUDRAFT_347759 [Daedalea quercina L-15889]